MAVATFCDTHPDIHLQIDVLDSEKIHSLVAEGIYDFGFVHYPEQELELTTRTIANASIMCLVLREHLLARKEPILASDLNRARVVTYPPTVQFGAAITKTIADAGAWIDPVISTNHSRVIRKFVETGRYLSLVDPLAICDGRSFSSFLVKHFEPTIPISLGVIVPQRRPLSRAAEEFVAQVGNLAKHLVEATREAVYAESS